MNDSNPPRELLLGTAGWARVDWVTAYYPDDLPEDWRLDYYANDCDCLLLDRRDRAAMDAEDLADALDELPDGFRCFVVLEDGERPADVGLLARLEASRCVLLVDRVDPTYSRLAQWAAIGADTWLAADDNGGLVRWTVDAGDLRALRALRVRAEALDPRVTALVVDGPGADPGRIGELRKLLELMGKA